LLDWLTTMAITTISATLSYSRNNFYELIDYVGLIMGSQALQGRCLNHGSRCALQVLRNQSSNYSECSLGLD
jgi:hypothetical protein